MTYLDRAYSRFLDEWEMSLRFSSLSLLNSTLMPTSSARWKRKQKKITSNTDTNYLVVKRHLHCKFFVSCMIEKKQTFGRYPAIMTSL